MNCKYLIMFYYHKKNKNLFNHHLVTRVEKHSVKLFYNLTCLRKSCLIHNLKDYILIIFFKKSDLNIGIYKSAISFS